MSGDLASQVASELARTPRVSRVVGMFIEQDGNLAVVEVNGSQVKIPMVGYQPYPGTPVWVETQNGRLVCAGSSYQFSPYATVMASPASGKVRVQVDEPRQHGRTRGVQALVGGRRLRGGSDPGDEPVLEDDRGVPQQAEPVLARAELSTPPQRRIVGDQFADPVDQQGARAHHSSSIGIRTPRSRATSRAWA